MSTKSNSYKIKEITRISLFSVVILGLIATGATLAVTYPEQTQKLLDLLGWGVISIGVVSLLLSARWLVMLIKSKAEGQGAGWGILAIIFSSMLGILCITIPLLLKWLT